jgi:hypothetical protein
VIELRWAFGHEDSSDSVRLLTDDEVASRRPLQVILDRPATAEGADTVAADRIEAVLFGGDYATLLAELDGVAGHSGSEWFKFLSVATFHGGLTVRTMGVAAVSET